MLILALIFLAACFLAYSNGANDNFKGVATLFGSKTTNYKVAIWWATATTFAGSVVSIFLAEALVKKFSGKGLVPDATAASPDFLLAVALGAGCTVMLATVLGFPISTTHGLTGALVGSGLVAVGSSQVNFSVLGKTFFLPLLASPFTAILLAAPGYALFHWLRLRVGMAKEWCLCIGEKERIIPIPQPRSAFSFAESGAALSTVRETMPEVAIDTEENCTERYSGRFLGINSQKALDTAHYISGGALSFARGLNDTPKIVGLMLALKALSLQADALFIGVAMAVGGLLNARKVAVTMSKKITPMNHGQGFTANLVSSFLVIAASRFGLPVSTTHVSVGSLVGIGLVTRKADFRVIGSIVLSWVLTLPIAAVLGGLFYGMIRNT